MRNAAVFELARRLKGVPHLTDADATDLEPIVRKWFRWALPVIRTKEWAVTWADFCLAWKNVAFPAGEGPALDLMRLAADGPALPEAAAFADPVVRRLVAVCAALDAAARKVGGDSFFLSCRTAAEVCGFPGENGYRTAHRWLVRLVDRGLLAVATPGVRGRASRTATSYRFRPETPGVTGTSGPEESSNATPALPPID
jgi:hypothetical protein